MELHLSKEDLKGFEVDLNSFIDEFVLKVADGAPLSFTTFRKMWKARNMSFVVATPLDLRCVPRHIQSVFMTILDRIDQPSPLRHVFKKIGRPKRQNTPKGSTDPPTNGGTEDDIIANLVQGAGFEGFEDSGGKRGYEEAVDMDTIMQETAQVLGLADQSVGGEMSVGTNQRSEEAREVDRWGNMINDAMVAGPMDAEPGVSQNSAGRVQSSSGGAKASDFSRDISRDPRRRADGPYNLENRAGSPRVGSTTVKCPDDECQGNSSGGDLGWMQSEDAGASPRYRHCEKSRSAGSMENRKSPAVSGDRTGGSVGEMFERQDVQVPTETAADAQPSWSGRVSNSSAGIESLLAKVEPRGGTHIEEDILAALDEDLDGHLRAMETSLVGVDPMVKMQPPEETEVGPIDGGSWSGGMSDIGGDYHPFVKEDLGVDVVGPCPTEGPSHAFERGAGYQENEGDPGPRPSLSSGSLNISELARQVMGGGHAEEILNHPPPPTTLYSGEEPGGFHHHPRHDREGVSYERTPAFDRNLDCWVPFEAKVAAVFAVYVCYNIQVFRPKSLIHVPYTVLSGLVEMLPELYSRGTWDCLKILKTLLMENAFVFGIYRRPPPGQGVPTPVDPTEIEMGCELILHMKTTLKGACNPGGVQLHCKRYNEARSLLSKLGNWTCGLIGRKGTTEALFDCSLGTRLDKIISEQQHLMQECVAAKEIRHNKRGSTEIKDLHRKSLNRLYDDGPWQKDLGIHLAPSKRWLMLEQRAKETAAEKRKRAEEKQIEKEERRRSERSEWNRKTKWKLTESEAEELEMLKGLPRKARAVSMRDFERKHMARLGLPYSPPPIPQKKRPTTPKRKQPPARAIKMKRKKIVPFPSQKPPLVIGDSKHLMANVCRTRPLDVSIEKCDLVGIDWLSRRKKVGGVGPRGKEAKATECDNLNSISDDEGNEGGGVVGGKDGETPCESGGKNQASGSGQDRAREGEKSLEEGEKFERDLDETLQDIDRMLDEEMALS